MLSFAFFMGSGRLDYKNISAGRDGGSADTERLDTSGLDTMSIRRGRCDGEETNYLAPAQVEFSVSATAGEVLYLTVEAVGDCGDFGDTLELAPRR